jgi:hypothetical protein
LGIALVQTNKYIQNMNKCWNNITNRIFIYIYFIFLFLIFVVFYF